MFVREKGIALLVVIIVSVIFAIMGLGALIMAENEVILTRIDMDKARAFYMAEAGLAKFREVLQKDVKGNIGDVFDYSIEETLDRGCYSVKIVEDEEEDTSYVLSTGTSGSIQKQIRVQANFLAPPFENAIYAMNKGGSDWALQIRGIGDPVSTGSGEENGGKDIINGNIHVDGDVCMYGESTVNPAPQPNTWNLRGDVMATRSINVFDTAIITGSRFPNSGEPDTIDVTTMDYVDDCSHNVSEIFHEAGVSSGYLPRGNEIRNVFIKNPSDRKSECDSTTGDDYFFEPSYGISLGNWDTGDTLIGVGVDRVYYVDGDVWIHSKETYGFEVEGRATIIATGDIHICDNIEYKDDDSVLGLVALGNYDVAGNLISGGNIYFGDPRYGTMYIVSAMMFAANNFLFNTDNLTGEMGEPDTGFTVNGCFSAMNKVSIVRDWYTRKTRVRWRTVTEERPAYYNPKTGNWHDAEDGDPISTIEEGTLRHYQMIINYDDRVRSADTQPPLLPRGGTKIFSGFSKWEEL